MDGVRWYDNESVAEAVEVARRDGKPLLVDFWSPTCMGCAKLFAVTYRDAGVRPLLAHSFVCVKYNTKAPNEWFKRLNPSFAHLWHPSIAVLDERLTEARRFIGFLPPRDFVAQLRVGLGLVHLYHGRPQLALEAFDQVADESPDAGVAPEALYWAGVAAYRTGGGLAALTPKWEAIGTRYPGSDWATRADCLDVEIAAGGFSMADPDSVKIVQAAQPV